jgi:hypothetical protein
MFAVYFADYSFGSKHCLENDYDSIVEDVKGKP